MTEPENDRRELDPVFVSSFAEMKWILLTWLISFTWVVGYCWLHGYPAAGEPVNTTMGIPSWAFWGVFVPWIVTALLTAWFAMCVMKDHVLEDPDELEQTDV